MALKLTSKEGKVQQLVGTPLTCYLYDFDIDGATLKPEHLNWLDQLKQKVVDPTKSSGKGAAGLYVWLYGNASRTGDDAHNIGLSTRRALEVNNVVERKLVGIPHFTIVIPQGEALAKQRGWEDDTQLEFFRSVTVVAGMYGIRPPAPEAAAAAQTAPVSSR